MNDDPLSSSASEEVPADLREEMQAMTAENRRNARRIFDALKQFGGVLDALSEQVQSQPAPAQPSPGPDTALLLGVIELNDRIERIQQAVARRPAQSEPWWPPFRNQLLPWQEDRTRMEEAFSILVQHTHDLLTRTGLVRIATQDQRFDPACMTAVEASTRPELPDHTVLEELLPGWRDQQGQIVRPAQVRVSRQPTSSNS